MMSLGSRRPRSAPCPPALYGDGDRSLDTPGKEFSSRLKDVRAECQLFGRRDGEEAGLLWHSPIAL